MPYTPKQCTKFHFMSKRGERVPQDWKKHCKHSKRGTRNRRRNHMSEALSGG